MIQPSTLTRTLRPHWLRVGMSVCTEPTQPNLRRIHRSRTVAAARLIQHTQYGHGIDERATRRRHVPPALVFYYRQRCYQKGAEQHHHPQHIDPQQKNRQSRQRAVGHSAVLATSTAQSSALWQLRESISSAQAKEGKNIKHDISLPIARIVELIAVTDALLQQHFPDCRNVTFGHLGDGNLHCNVSPALGVREEAFIARQAEINRVVHDSVDSMGGSISAEHGLGALKREEILRLQVAGRDGADENHQTGA